jgi:hypothetical protein
VFRLRGRSSFEATFIEAVVGYSGRVACFEGRSLARKAAAAEPH